MTARYLVLTLALCAASIVISGCTNDPLSPERAFAVQATNLVPLGPDAYYELWFSYPNTPNKSKGPVIDHGDGAYFSAGKFNVDASGNLVGITGGAPHFAIPAGYNPQLLIDALVTVERAGDNHTEPGARFLSGEITGNESTATSTLTPDGDDALGGKVLSDSSGTFSLSAPTSDLSADGISGIWFVQFPVDTGGRPVDTLPGLRLAPQPLNPDNPDWTYQAWLVHNEGTAQVEYIKLGRFDSPNGPDSTAAGTGAGSNPTRIYAAPGEDFVTGARRTLNDGTYGVIVGVEPDNVPLSRPIISLLRADRIPLGIAAKAPVSLFRPFEMPSVQFDINR